MSDDETIDDLLDEEALEGGGPRETEVEGDPWRDPETGRFLPGHPGGPGRPAGFDVRLLARRMAKKEGVDLEEAIWSVVKKLLADALRGNIRAASLALRQLALPQPKDAGVVVNVANQANAGASGPPVPTGVELHEYVERLAEITRELGVEGPSPGEGVAELLE